MGSEVGIKIEGGRQLRRSLRQAGDDLEDLKAAHTTAGQIVSARSKRLAPVKTGALAATVRPGATKTAAIIRAGKKRVPYAGPIHWGWFARHIRPTLFIARAAKETEPAWVPLYMAELNKAINKVKGI